MRIVWERPWLSSFTTGYMAVFGVSAVLQSNREFVFYAACMILVIALVLYAHRMCRFSGLALWMLSLWGLVHMIGGLVPAPGADASVMYNLWLVDGMLRFDHVVHAYGFAAATLVCWEALQPRLSRTPPTTLLLPVSAALMGLGLGAVNELVEFAATRLLPETNVGGYENTGWDLVSNAFGCVAAATTLALVGYGDARTREHQAS
ncbi:MAG: DUF2238 domain-containing protein [Phycisphaerales bacterium]